jgi:hypothetical protein
MSLSGFIPMKSLPSAPPPNESVVLFARDLSVGIKSVTEQDELVETLQADVQAKERALAKLEEAKAKLLGEMTSAQATGEAEKDTEKKKVAKPSLNEQYGTCVSILTSWRAAFRWQRTTSQTRRAGWLLCAQLRRRSASWLFWSETSTS